jgi:hypothetical protein
VRQFAQSIDRAGRNARSASISRFIIEDKEIASVRKRLLDPIFIA